MLTAASGIRTELTSSSQQNLYDIYLLLCVRCWTPDDGQTDSPKHVEFHSKNKFEKLAHLVGFVIRIYHDAQFSECQIVYVSWVERDQLDATYFIIALFSAQHISDVLTSETCWALNKVIIKQVASSWSLFTQLSRWCMVQ